MSDDREQLIDLDARPADATERRDRLRSWLLTSGWIADPYDEPDEWTLGAHARALFPDFHVGSIQLTDSDGLWMVDGNPEAPTCPECGTESEEYWEELEQWAASGEEPVGTCESCGFTAPYGDWVIGNTPVGGSLGLTITFASSEFSDTEFADALLAEVKQALGGRWAHTHMHL